MTHLTSFKLPLLLLLRRHKKGGLKMTRVMRHILIFFREDRYMFIEVDPYRQRDSKGYIFLVVDVCTYLEKSLSNEDLHAFSFRRFFHPGKIEVRIYKCDKGILPQISI